MSHVTPELYADDPISNRVVAEPQSQAVHFAEICTVRAKKTLAFGRLRALAIPKNLAAKSGSDLARR